MDPFTARTPLDLLALVPIVIGFHPTDSAVVLTLGASSARRIGGRLPNFHARVDLPLLDADQQAVARMLREVVARHGVGMVGLVVYTDDAGAAERFTEVLVGGLVGDGVSVVDALRVDQGRFYAVDDPDDPGSVYDLSSHPFTARAVLEGQVVHQNRTALRDSLVGTDPDDIARVGVAASAAVDSLTRLGAAGESLSEELVGQTRWLQRRIEEGLVDGAAMTDVDVARVLVLVSFEAVREVAWASMTRMNASRHVELWRQLFRRAPSDLRAGAGGLLAFAAWLAGDGALAWCAIDRCLETDPGDQLCRHVAELVGSATPPSVWTPIPAQSLRIFGASAWSAR